jgi:low temperature requirement protein LtrA
MSRRWSKATRIPLNRIDAGVAPLELYFDLVFVFAITQVTILMAHDIGPVSILRGALILGVLWSGWAGYSWLGNMAVTHAAAVRNLLLTAMSAMFILALSIPEAFHDAGGGVNGPLVVATCYLVFRGLHLWMYWMLSAADPDMRRQLVRFTPAVCTGIALMYVAAGAHGTVQTLLWVGVLSADFVGVAIGGAGGWKLRSTGHFSERHGEIIIIALGESILAIGIAVRDDAISWPIIGASLLGLMLATALWWIYFDVTAEQGEHRLQVEPEESRAGLARNAYSLIHLPMVLGIVLTALGLKKVMQYAGTNSDHTLADPMKATTLFALVGGIILYLLAHAAFRWRLELGVYVDRFVAVGVLGVLWILGHHIAGLTFLILVTATMATIVTYESVAHAPQRNHPSTAAADAN